MTEDAQLRLSDPRLGELGMRHTLPNDMVRYGDIVFLRGEYVLVYFGDRSIYGHIEALHAVPPNDD